MSGIIEHQHRFSYFISDAAGWSQPTDWIRGKAPDITSPYIAIEGRALCEVPKAVDDKLTPEEAWTILCETSDVTSPEDYPDHALITFEQLRSYMERAVVPAVAGDAE